MFERPISIQVNFLNLEIDSYSKERSPLKGWSAARLRDRDAVDKRGLNKETSDRRLG